jgi:hypothetical protein
MRRISPLIIALLLLGTVADVHAGGSYGGLNITSVRDYQIVSASSLMFTSGRIPADRPTSRVTGTRMVQAYAGFEDSRGVYVVETTNSTSVNRFFSYWNVRLNGSRVSKYKFRRSFVYASSRYFGSSWVHAASLVDHLTFR